MIVAGLGGTHERETRPLGQPSALLLLEGLAARAGGRADEVSLRTVHRDLTAEQLLAEAGGVAARIRDLDPDGTAPVPVFAGRHATGITAAVGVLLAGRPVAILDPVDVSARAAGILEELGATVVVDARRDTSGPAVDGDALPGHAPAIEAAAVRPVDVGDVELPEVAPHDTVAVVYTSGSTGRPKGVVYDATMLDGLVGRRRNLVEPADGRMPMWTGPAVSHIAMPLLAEGCLVLAPDQDPTRLLAFVAEQEMEVLALTPSMLRAAAAAWPEGRTIPSIDRITTFGEALRGEDVATIRAVVGEHVAVRAIYGGTEAAGGSMLCDVRPGDPVAPGPLPLGRPAPGVEVRLEAAPGVDPSELSGPGPLVGIEEPDAPTTMAVVGPVAAGYWADPVRTAVAFSVEADGRRCWRTGDLVRVDADGRWWHAGRADELVKINGRLVSPLEVQHALGSVPGVRRAVVVAGPGPRGPRLVAHVEPEPGRRPSDVRRGLADLVPPHLVPGVFVRHDAIPTTERSKEDRVALARAPVVPWRDPDWVPPQGEVEELVARSIPEIAGLDSTDAIGRDDDLFALGVDSLGVAELVTILAEAGFEVSVDDLLDAPTPRLLARRARRGSRPDDLVLGSGERTEIWLLPGAGGTGLGMRPLARALDPDRPLVILETPGLHRGAVPRSVRAEAAAHLRTIARLRSTRFVEHRRRPVLLMGHSHGGLVATVMAARLRSRGTPAVAVALDSKLPGTTTTTMIRRFAGDVRRARPGRKGRDLRRVEPAEDTGVWDLLEQLRRDRSWGDVLARRPVAVGMPQGAAGVAATGGPAHYVRFIAEAARQADGFRGRAGEVPDLLVLGRDDSAEPTWRRLGGARRTAQVDAGHLSMLQPPEVARLGEIVSDFFDEVDPR